MVKRQIFRKRRIASKKQPHVRWSYERGEAKVFDDNTGVYYFTVVGERRDRIRILSYLSEDLSKAGLVNELVGESVGKIEESKYNFSVVKWESQASPERINWKRIGVPNVRDRDLYTRIKEDAGIDLVGRLEDFFAR